MKRFTVVCLVLFFCVAIKVNAGNGPDDLMPVRGFCIAAPRPADLDNFIEFIDHELAPRGVNTLARTLRCAIRKGSSLRFDERAQNARP